jgi:predicted CXXCH cytochrome family protein
MAHLLFLSGLRRQRRSALLPSAAILLGMIGIGLGSGCRRNAPPPPERTAAAVPAPAAERPAAKSADCRSCHEAQYQAWADSHHARAHRPVSPTADAAAFSPRDLKVEGVDYAVGWNAGKPELREQRTAGSSVTSPVEFVLGHTPLQQFVVPVGGGRYQMTELAFDPAKREWFNVFGAEHRQPGEWGHWQGRGMNWNSMCAHCQLTQFTKNYQSATDTYASTWSEHGVGCAQCHDLPANHADAARKTPPSTKTDLVQIRQQAQETCAPCHARNELLTGNVRPGVPYSDHYRLTLPTEPGVFYADGQMRDEDFNTTSLLLSRMGGKANVTCLDCHEPHGGRPRLSVENNALCLQCHGNASVRADAPRIDPTAHSHHGAGSKGNQCVSCHMPTTTFMQRDPRHDHSFSKPDPLLTKELSIPNACNRCHTDRDVDWAIAAANQWYGPKLESRQRERARAVAAAQALSPGAGASLMKLFATEEVPAWRASLLLLARPYAAQMPAAIDAARTGLQDSDPLVRSAAVQLLGASNEHRELVRPLLKDPVRLVRLDAAWALSEQLGADSAERKELDAYMAVMADQPAGQLRIGQDLFNRGRLAEAEASLRKAAEGDPNSAGIFSILGTVLNSAGRDAESAAAFWRAAQKDPADANAAFSAGLAFAAAGKLPDAEIAMREATRRDPTNARAWYNLGLLLAQTGRAPEGIEAILTAEKLAPNVPDYPYARATLLLNRGDRTGGSAALQRTLQLDPNHAEAAALLRRLRN